jgi:soluble cytochrome b562
MKMRFLPSSLLLVALAGAVPALQADEPQPPAPSAPPAAAAAAPKKEDKTDLEKQMDVIGHTARALKKQINDATQNDTSLQLVAKIREAAIASLNLVPVKAADLTGPDRDKFIADYQAGMKQFIDAVDTLAGALTAGDNAEAVKDFQRLGALERQDHKQFRKPENH